MRAADRRATGRLARAGTPAVLAGAAPYPEVGSARTHAGLARRDAMRRAVLACGLVLLLAAAVWALPPTNQELFIQPDESFPWVCDFGVTIVGTPTLTL